MRKQDQAIEFLRDALKAVSIAKEKNITIRMMEIRDISHECKKDLQLVDGAMCCVGDTVVLGTAYEMRIEVKK